MQLNFVLHCVADGGGGTEARGSADARRTTCTNIRGQPAVLRALHWLPPPKSDSLDSTRPSALDTCCVRSHKRNLSRYDRQFVKVVYLNYQFRVPRYFLFVCVRTVIILCCLLCFVTLTHWRCTVYFQYGRLFTVSTYVLNFNLFIFKRLRAGVTVDQLINATEKRSRHELHYRIQHRRSYASLQADRFLWHTKSYVNNTY